MSSTFDPVVIRVWKGDDSDVFALFPVLPADNAGNLCTSYQHVGQHGAADYGHCIRNSRPAKKRKPPICWPSCAASATTPGRSSGPPLPCVAPAGNWQKSPKCCVAPAGRPALTGPPGHPEA